MSTPHALEPVDYASTASATAARADNIFHTLAEHAPTMLWLTDTDGGLIYFNQRWLAFTGLPMSAVVGAGWVDCLHPEDRERCLDYGLARVAQRKPIEMEYRLRRHDGAYRDMLVLGEPFSDSQGAFAGYCGCTVDITGQKEDEARLIETNAALGKRSRDIGLLNELNDNLQVCKNIEETRPILKRYGRQLFPDTLVTVSLYNESRNLVEPFVHWGGEVPFDHVFSPEECWALRKSKPHCELAEDGDVICPNFSACQGKRYLCVPMLAYGEVMGNLHIEFAVDAGFATDTIEEVRQLATVASDQIALALANLKLRATLQFQSSRDALTQLYNRRYLVEALEREIARSQRGGKPVTVMVMDVDHFKRYNDTYGHDAGDHVLREAGALFRNELRVSDIAARYGGEEFVIVLPDSSACDALQRANKLREKFAAMRLEFHGEQLGEVTLSIGIADFPTHGEDTEGLLSAADSALYAAKAQGRNCVIVAETAQTESLM